MGIRWSWRASISIYTSISLLSLLSPRFLVCMYKQTHDIPFLPALYFNLASSFRIKLNLRKHSTYLSIHPSFILTEAES